MQPAQSVPVVDYEGEAKRELAALGINAPVEADLIARGFQKQNVDYLSSVTNITYRIPIMLNAATGEAFIFMIFQNAKRVFTRHYLNPRVAAGQASSDADRILALPQNVTWELVKYPDPAARYRPNIPGLEGLMTNGIFFIAPKWCIIGLYALEAYVTSGTPSAHHHHGRPHPRSQRYHHPRPEGSSIGSAFGRSNLGRCVGNDFD